MGEAISRAPTCRGDEEVGKGSAEAGCQYKEYQDGTMHGYQGIIEFGLQFTARSPMTEDIFQPGNAVSG